MRLSVNIFAYHGLPILSDGLLISHLIVGHRFILGLQIFHLSLAF